MVQVLRDNAPVIATLPTLLAYDPTAFQRNWNRQGLNGRLSTKKVPGTVRDAYGVINNMPDVDFNAEPQETGLYIYTPPMSSSSSIDRSVYV